MTALDVQLIEKLKALLPEQVAQVAEFVDFLVEGASDYDRWVHRKATSSLADTRPNLAHDDVMAQAQAVIDAAQVAHARPSSG